MPSLIDQFLVGPQWNEGWHMTASERAILVRTLETDQARRQHRDRHVPVRQPAPHRALQQTRLHLRHRCQPAPGRRRVPSVEFITGDSSQTLPPVIAALNASDDEEVNFILIDGSHEVEGVRADIAACLAYRPKRTPTFILMHDSSNPKVREGIATAPWAECPFVHELDLDLCPGSLYDRADIHGEIWGGLAGALMLPVPRTGPLKQQAGFEYSRQALLKMSSYEA